MENKVLKFRTINRDIFNAIKDGTKKIETRAATEKYCRIKVGDVVTLVCGKSKFRKKIKCVEIFKTITAMLKKHKPEEINPACKSAGELRKMYHTFPGYREKIKKYGLVAWELK